MKNDQLTRGKLLRIGGLLPALMSIIFGVGLGWLYIAGNRSVVASASARIVFQCGAFLLEALRVV